MYRDNKANKSVSHIEVLPLMEEGMSVQEFQQTLQKSSTHHILGGYVQQQLQKIEAFHVKKDTSIPVLALTCSSARIVAATADLNKEDVAGCLLDADSLYTLFGTTKAQGQQLIWQENTYQVRGVLLTDQPCMVVQNTDEKAYLSGVILQVKKELYRGQYSQNEMTAYPVGEEGYYTKDYLSFFHWLTTPNQWSDLSFYGDLQKEYKNRIDHIRYANKDVLETIYVRLYYKRLQREAEILILAVLMVITGRVWKRRGYERLI